MYLYQGYEDLDIVIPGDRNIILLQIILTKFIQHEHRSLLFFSFTMIPSIISFYISKKLLNASSKFSRVQEDNTQFSNL